MKGKTYVGREIMDHVKAFVQTLLHPPENCPIEDMVILLATLRLDITKVHRFHSPENDSDTNINIDDLLKNAGINLETAIAQGLEEHEIEFLIGIRGITVERCYQTMQERRSVYLPDEEILATRDGVYDDYIHLGDKEAVRLTKQTYACLRREADEAVRLAEAFSPTE